MRRIQSGACRAMSALAVAVLASCGGGGSDDSVQSSTRAATAVAGNRSATAKSYVPPNAIPADANVRGMWSPVYDWPLISVHSAILPDGRVMTYGSDLTGMQTGHANYDVWDSTGAPDAGHMTLPNTTGTDIFCSSQVLLPASGDLFIAGGDIWTGTSTTNQPNNNSNLFDPPTNTLTRGNNMQRARWYSSSITLVDGETYIQGGSGGSDFPEIRGTDGSFRLMSGLPTSSLGSSFPRNFIAPDGRIFGYAPDGGQMYFIDPTGVGSYTSAGSFNTAISGGWYSSAAMYSPGHILQIGGNSNGAFTIDITGSAPVVTQTQSMSSTRAWVNATILADGKVAATSGSAVAGVATGYNNTAEVWDPATGQWMEGPAAQKMRLYHSNAILLPDGSVLTSGGGAISPQPPSGDPDTNNLNAEVYYPAYLFAAGGVRAARPTIVNAPTYMDIGKTYGVDVSGLETVSRVTLVKTGSDSHSFNFDQRFLELTFNAIGTHLTFQAPTHAGAAPPGYYMLFVFNESGVPSVAKIIRMGVASDPNPAITPVMSAPANQSSTVGAVASLVLAATDPNGDTLTYAASGLPPGLSVNPGTGVISGTPTSFGTFNVTVTATDGVNTTSSSFGWTVQGAAPLTLASPPVPGFVAVNAPVTYTASATGGVGLDYQWNFGDGSAATAWSSSPGVSHAYASGGTFMVTVTVTDATGETQSRSFTQAVYLPATAKRPAASTNLVTETPASGNPRVWVVNQDNDSVSAFDATTLAKLGEIAVGASPRSLALSPGGQLWVVNKQAATISVIDTSSRALVQTIALPRGSAPFGIVMSPTAGKAYVALEAGGSVLAFDTTSRAQIGSVAVGQNVRQLSISADGSSLYASRFVSPLLPGESTATVSPTAGTGGEVVQIATSSMAVSRTIVLQNSTVPDTEISGGGIPNYLGAVAISPDGTQAFVPSKQDNVQRGALRNGNPLTFQNTVRAVSSRIDLTSNSETLSRRIDHDNASLASAAVFDSSGVYLFVALETSREVAVINAFSGAQLFRVDVGRAPEGLALSGDGTRLYVNNFMDRTVSVFDLTPLLDQGRYSLDPVATLAAVATDKLAANVLQGKQLFYDARDTRLARDRYMSCAACHDDGGHDGRVWDFTSQGEGLRNTIPLRGRGGMGEGFLHWSANFDEVQDFEGQIRTLAGGTGLMTDAQFNTGTVSQPLGQKKAGISADLDALAAYLGSLTTFAPSPYRQADGSMSAAALAGKTVFINMNCAQCHAGAAYTASADGSALVNIGTIKSTSGSRLGGPLPGIDIPTLRDVWATAPYLHDGSAPTLASAIQAHKNVTATAAQITSLASYLREIGGDEAGAPFNAGTGALFGSSTTGTAFADSSAAPLTGVMLRVGFWMNGIEGINAAGTLPYHGGAGGSAATISLPTGQYLVRIYGSAGSTSIGKISFVTNTGKVYGPYGSNQGQSANTAFDYTVPAGTWITGFSGTTGPYVHTLGVTYSAITTVPAGVSPLYGTSAIGTAFADTGGAALTGVNLRTGRWMNGLQGVIGSAVQTWHGGTGGVAAGFTLPPGQYLVRIFGSASDTSIGQISFVSNAGKTYGPYGTNQGLGSNAAFDFTVPAGSKIQGFTGTAGGYVYKLGVLYGP